VYIREAHPSDSGWADPQVDVEQPKTAEERREVAGSCVKDLKLSIPTLIDTMENRTDKAYSAWPDRLYLIDQEGKISFKGGPGPFGFKPDDLEAALKKLGGKPKSP
jgi:type I thyroxine 5'-deiodinase